MKVKDFLNMVPESELLYIGFCAGGGFAYILRKRDIHLDEIDAQMKKHIWQSYRKNYLILQGVKDKTKVTKKRKELDELYVKWDETEKKLEEIKQYMGVPFSEREVLDFYPVNNDPDALGTAVIVDGCEKPRGKWFMDDNGGAENDN